MSPQVQGSPPQGPPRVTSKLREYAESILWAVLLALVIRYCFVEAYRIPSGSMEDTLLIGDHLLANKIIYGIRIPFTGTRVLKIRDPRRGDIVVFRFPEDRSKDFIKRVVGVPGDVVAVRNKKVYVNGNLYVDRHEVHKDPRILPAGLSPRDNFGPVRVPLHSYFMMGDNRDNSYDSRFWGYVKDSDLEGEAMIEYWSWDSTSGTVRWNRIGRLLE